MTEDHRHRDGTAASHWRAELELWFDTFRQRTRLSRRRHLGPLVVQKPFHPEPDGTCHIYLLHPPGGVAGGDELHLTFHLAERSRVVLTTPAATKFYRSGWQASQHSMIHVGSGASCEYLPQETILFDGAQAELRTCVLLDENATYTGWDFICLGRPAAGERFHSGAIVQRVEIFRNGRPLWFERLCLPAGSPLQTASHGLAGHPVFGTMVCVGRLADDLSESVRQAVGATDDCWFSVSQLDDVIVCRYLGPQAEQGKKLFGRAWNALRAALQSKPAFAPRVWST